MSKRDDYRRELEDALSFLDAGARLQVLSFYEEMIEDRMEDGLTEDQAIESMESPEKIAASLREEYGAGGLPAVRENAVEKGAGRGVGAMVVRLRDRGVELTPSRDDEIHLRYQDRPGGEIEVREENGVLYVTEPRVGLFDYIRQAFTSIHRNVEVSVPVGMHLALDVRTSNGKIEAEGLDVKEIDFVTSNSAVEFKNVRVEARLAAKTSNAGIRLRSVAADEVDLFSSNHSLKVKGGDFGKLTVKTSNGAAEVKDAGAAVLSVETSNGRIEVDNIVSDNISLITSNGSIRGTLPGREEDWAITSRTSNGKNSLPKNQAGEKPLIVLTSNGSIQLGFRPVKWGRRGDKNFFD